MPGIYIHIPFCRQACHYCDFHFSTNTEIRGDMVRALRSEITLRRNYLGGNQLDTIYFGGGTPSLLEPDEISSLLETIAQTHSIAPDAEITLEANPDDLSVGRLRDLRTAGINRLSIGIQSFDDRILTLLNRVHSSQTAIQCVADARDAGFDNISIDLIYAISGLSPENWEHTLQQAIELRTQHISAYTLTIEEKTTFGNWLKKGRMTPVDELLAASQMENLVATLSAAGYRHYEISNFAIPGFESRHNIGYWKGEPYLGIGPSAHSYDEHTRQHNIENNYLYVRAIQENRIPAEAEQLTRSERINEYILTTLRTDAGCDLGFLKTRFGYDVAVTHAGYLDRLKTDTLVEIRDNRLILTEAGRLLADQISTDLFLIE